MYRNGVAKLVAKTPRAGRDREMLRGKRAKHIRGRLACSKQTDQLNALAIISTPSTPTAQFPAITVMPRALPLPLE